MITNLDDFSEIVFSDKQYKISKQEILNCKKSEEFLLSEIAKGRIIYGINTGFGPLANIRIPDNNIPELQKNLIYHLATGVGSPYSTDVARSIFLCRIICLAKGYSGISIQNLALIINIFNLGLIPFIPSLGTVGASGDLTPLSHLALCFLGEGYFLVNEKKIKAKTIFSKFKLKPIQLNNKDGLALVNGTSAMTGVAMVNSILAEKLISISILLSFIDSEVYSAKEEVFSILHSKIKHHHGIKFVLEKFQKYMRTSKRFQKNKIYQKDKSDKLKVEEIIQDPYSIRTIPQVLGAAYDFIQYHNLTILNELNSVSDNPIIFAQEKEILHGGNFQGTHTAMASDMLFNAITNIAILSERSIARITDPKLNKDLPAFITVIDNGLQSGFMGAQVTATSILAYIRTLATPASIQSISTNANNQDIVSMGTIAANKTNEAVEKLFLLLAIQSLVLTQAMELNDMQDFSNQSKRFFQYVRKYSPTLKKDRPLYEDIERTAKQLKLFLSFN